MEYVYTAILLEAEKKNNYLTSMAGKDFFDLVKAIGESKSKQEEDRIVTEEVL